MDPLNPHYRQPVDYTAVVHQFGQSHALELEQGPSGINALESPRTVIGDDGANVVAAAPNDSQILPSQVKCGSVALWKCCFAYIALVAVFLASLGFWIDHWDTPVVVIFSIFLVLFVFTVGSGIFTYTDMQRDGQSPNRAIEHIQQIDQMDQIDAQLSNTSEVINADMMSAPPPPYHKAITAMKDIDESPPPSYDNAYEFSV